MKKEGSMTSLVDNQIEAAEKEWLELWKKGPIASSME